MKEVNSKQFIGCDPFKVQVFTSSLLIPNHANSVFSLFSFKPEQKKVIENYNNLALLVTLEKNFDHLQKCCCLYHRFLNFIKFPHSS